MRARAESKVDGPLGQTVLEVMGTLMAPARAEKLLTRALAMLGWQSVPEDPSGVRELVEGPLQSMIAEEIGVDVAAFVLDDLAPILELATSGVRSTKSQSGVREQSSTIPAPIARDGELLIAVATLGSLEELKRHVGPFADVVRVRDAFELFSMIDARRGPMLVVIDGHRPALQLSTLAMLLQRIPDGCRLLLWGYDQPDLPRYLSIPRWSTIDSPEGWLDLADSLRDFG